MKRRARKLSQPFETLEQRELLALSIANIPATGITSRSATIGANLLDDGGAPATVTLFWGDNDGGTNVGEWDSILSLGARSAGEYRSDLTQLDHSTQYYFRAHAFSLSGQAWADDTASFTTAQLPPPVSTVERVFHISESSAVVNARIESEEPLVWKRIYYGPDDGGENEMAWESHIDVDSETIDFSRRITGLISDTTYFVRAAASDGSVIGWSNPLSFTTSDAPPLRISEIMANNATTLPTRIRLSAENRFSGPQNTHDWLEIQNNSTATIDLTGYSLTDTKNDLIKWTFPAGVEIAAGQSIVVFASSLDIKDRELDEQGILHTNFSLRSEGEYLALVSPESEIVHEFPDGFAAQQIDASHGYFGTNFGELPLPSSGNANDPIGPAISSVRHEVYWIARRQPESAACYSADQARIRWH